MKKMTINTNMGNVAVINLINKNKYLDYDFFADQTVMERVLAYSSKLPEIEQTCILLSKDEMIDSSLKKIVKEKWTEEDLFEVFSGFSNSYDNIFYFWGDYPLLDNELTDKMYGNHIKYYAGYTFADGFPLGFSPEILRSSDIPLLYQLSKGSKKDITRNTVFNILQKDINAFDIETEISPIDLRMYRISLSCDNKRNSELLKSFIKRGIVNTESLLDKIEDFAPLLRTKPAYYQIQITDSCPQLCSYCPFSKEAVSIEKRESMTLENYKIILDKIEEFSDDAHIALSAWGEPSLHEDFISLVQETLERENLTLIIETSGLGWSEEILRKIKDISTEYDKSVQWIVSLDALDRDLYKKLRGDGY
ncbi:MAG: spiro-SPASM protein, partial [Spirochaetaceae bacterium]|nr:spiro-SPASM protein [Spirochaetaceae bacterium]